ncbi:NAD-dependent formate dehydrogenase gamma subunit [gamma proteobacterium IMCC2047]|nr:NAD-dependent formate dehydrogenase gamma subunit [gamma proteobacterium IMCC2047]
MAEQAQWDRQRVSEIIHSTKSMAGALLPMLHAIQDSQGYIPKDAVPMIAESLNQTRAEVHGVISFYHHFRQTPPARKRIEICRAEACQARGSRELEAYAKEKLGISYHGMTASRDFSLDPVYCLGNCACGPSVRIGDEVVGRVDKTRFDELVDDAMTLPLEISS